MMKPKKNPAMKKIKYLLLLLIGALGSQNAFAQSSELNWMSQIQQMDGSQLTLLVILGVVLLVILLLLGMMVYLMSFLNTFLKPTDSAYVAGPSWWDQFKEKHVVGKMQPIEAEKDMVLAHAHDGIVELDNHMPPWLKYLFYVTIVFGVIYFVNYTVLGIGQTQIEEYDEELRIASIHLASIKEKDLATIDETNVTFDKSGPSLKAGQSIYESNCAACHAQDGGGGVGPNLTDEYWVHGGSIEDVFRIVKYGVIEKGMVPWQDILRHVEIQQVSSYILTMQGLTPANPKDPQGEKYEPAIEEPLDALSGDDLGLEKVDS
jgi:cytochrome c oxidase cbb3-type subunit III